MRFQVKAILWVFGLAMLWAVPAFAQKSRFIEGRVIDAETGTALPLAMLRLRSRPVGTVANDEGYFSFHYPAECASDSLWVSMMGYKRYTISLQHLPDSAHVVIEMLPNPIHLPEIVVWGTEAKDARALMQKVMERIEQNYSEDPFLLAAFFRDVKVENGRYVSLLEAAVQVYDRNFHKAPRIPKKLLERVAIEELRRSYSYLGNEAWKNLLSRENSLTELLSSNFLRYQYGVFDPKLPYTYEHANELMLDGRLIYVIAVKEFPRTEIYVDAMSLAVVRFRYAQTGREKPEVVSDTLHRVATSTTIDFAFQEFQGKYFLKYMRSHTEYEDLNPATNAILQHTALKLDLLVNDVHIGADGKALLNRTMNKYKSLEEHRAGRYNETFGKTTTPSKKPH